MLRFEATLVDPARSTWGWEVYNDVGRLTFDTTRGDRNDVIRDIAKWYSMVFCRRIEFECQCGGTAAGYPVFGAGHSHWCPIGPGTITWEEDAP